MVFVMHAFIKPFLADPEILILFVLAADKTDNIGIRNNRRQEK
jgi:hypothetical protein